MIMELGQTETFRAGTWISLMGTMEIPGILALKNEKLRASSKLIMLDLG
jgi:hypothetical protein